MLDITNSYNSVKINVSQTQPAIEFRKNKVTRKCTLSTSCLPNKSYYEELGDYDLNVKKLK